MMNLYIFENASKEVTTGIRNVCAAIAVLSILISQCFRYINRKVRKSRKGKCKGSCILRASLRNSLRSLRLK
jgi:hypothetical protein